MVGIDRQEECQQEIPTNKRSFTGAKEESETWFS
jgi:hypothetical protein